MNQFRNSAAALVCAGWLLAVGAPGASADPTLTPVPQPQGPSTPIAQTPKDAGSTGSGPIAGTCFSCQPNRVSDNPGAARGPAPAVAPVLTHTNSGAYHDNLVVD